MMVNNGTEQGQDVRIQKTQAVLKGIEATSLGPPRWQVSPEPFWINAEEVGFFQDLGNHLLTFYQAINALYQESARGRLPQWITQYLDQGKPPDLVAYGRMNRFKSHLPGIIRPDIILTESSASGGSGGGRVCTELDSVPGGFGITGCLARLYSDQGYWVVGGGDGIVRGFARMIQAVAGQDHPNLAVVVSEESRDYRPEMQWLGEALRKSGFSAYVVKPGQVEFTEKGLFVCGKHLPTGIDKSEPLALPGRVRGVGGTCLPCPSGRRAAGRSEDQHLVLPHGPPHKIDVIYRFFELFDLKNIPKSELFLYGAKKDLVALTPPVKAFLEEKMAFALFYHPVLRPFWLEELGESTFAVLESIFPKTWILDPREVPPYAVIPDLRVGDRWITDWNALSHLGQKERRFVIKPSGFSELAWGSRGVTAGQDVSEKDWQRMIEEALGAFHRTPYILQEFHKGRQVEVVYYDIEARAIRNMSGRVRLCPYYFVVDGKAELAGILATVCPLDKKLLHGMADAVMVPCGIRENP